MQNHHIASNDTVFLLWADFLNTLIEDNGSCLRLGQWINGGPSVGLNDLIYLKEQVELLPVALRPKHVIWGGSVENRMASLRSKVNVNSEINTVALKVVELLSISRCKTLEIYSGAWLTEPILELVQEIPSLRRLVVHHSPSVVPDPEDVFADRIPILGYTRSWGCKVEEILLDGFNVCQDDLVELGKSLRHYKFLKHVRIEGQPGKQFFEQMNKILGLKLESLCLFSQEVVINDSMLTSKAYAKAVCAASSCPSIRCLSFGAPEVLLSSLVAGVIQSLQKCQIHPKEVKLASKITLSCSAAGVIQMSIRHFRYPKCLSDVLKVISQFPITKLNLASNVILPDFLNRMAEILESETCQIAQLGLLDDDLDSKSLHEIGKILNDYHGGLTSLALRLGFQTSPPPFLSFSGSLKELYLTFSDSRVNIFEFSKLVVLVHPRLRVIIIGVEGFPIDQDESQIKYLPAFMNAAQGLHHLKTLGLFAYEDKPVRTPGVSEGRFIENPDPQAPKLSRCQQQIVALARKHKTLECLRFLNADAPCWDIFIDKHAKPVCVVRG